MVSALVVLQPGIAQAWRVSTHGYSGDQVKADLADGDGLTINGHSYPVNASVNDAITRWPAYYDAGVIGPDGFPDIAYGQGVIHPGDPASTGRWLRYVLTRAWNAQGDFSGYSEDEKGQILAFAYGFLTHAAGDEWAHTLINDFAGGVFPPVSQVLDRLPAAEIALRHLVAEGYAGIATPGVDSPDADDEIETGERCDAPNEAPPDTICNPGTDDEQKIELSRVCADPSQPPTPGTRCTVEAGGEEDVPDVSVDATPGVQLEVPVRFLQQTMIDLTARTPADGCEGDGDGDPGCPDGTFATTGELVRGTALDSFLNTEANLQIQAAKFHFDADHTMCSTTVDPDCHDSTETLTVPTVRGTARVEVPTTTCTAQFFCVPSPVDVASDVIDGLIAQYVDAWRADIGRLRDHWGEFSLAVSRGLFDPQTLRDAQNAACELEGPESITNNARNACEAGVGHLDAIGYALDHFYPDGDPSIINRYLIPALGLPDQLGDIRGFLSQIGDRIEDLFTALGIRNPISELLADARKVVRDLLNETIKDQYGLDVEALEQFSQHPSQWMCGRDDNNPVSVTLPDPIGTVTPGGIFSPAEHARLDAIIGLPDNHHEPAAGLPDDCAPLSDDAKADPQQFAALKNTITTAKLLLLDGATLNQVLTDVLRQSGVIKDSASVGTYRDPGTEPTANIMIDGLDPATGATTPDAPWLELIDGDHAWRQDGLPRFCDNDGSGNCTALPADLPAGANPTPRLLADQVGGQRNGGNGGFPIWESCLLRPAFRALYSDWENGDAAFPDLGDAPSPDASDPDPPASAAGLSGHTFTAGDTVFVAPGAQVTLSAHDGVFTDARLGLRYRLHAVGTDPGPLTPIGNGGTVAVPAREGRYQLQFQADDPCHPFGTDAAARARTSGTSRAKAALSPSEALHSQDIVLDATGPTIDLTSPADGAVLDPTGTATISYTIDDHGGSGVGPTAVTLDGAPATNGQTLDLTALAAGDHSIVVTAADNVGNSSTRTSTFRLREAPGPTPTPTPSPTPTATPTHTPTAHPSPSGAASTPPPGQAGHPGSPGLLPHTGADVLAALLTGLGLLVIGAAVLLAGRRRRAH